MNEEIGQVEAGATIGIIQARLGSSRLPAKILAPLGHRCLLDLLVTRLAGARVREWWLATTDSREDNVTEAWGHALGLRVYRGHREDVLSRFTSIIDLRKPEWVVRMTADDPFCDAALVNQLLDARDAGEANSQDGKHASLFYFAHRPGRREAGTAPSPPLGYGAQLARAQSVLAASREIPPDRDFHRAHVLSWLDAQGEGREVDLPADWPHRPHWRWTLDTFEDLAMVRSAFELFGLRAASIGYREMVAELDRHPEITELNRQVEQKSLELG